MSSSVAAKSSSVIVSSEISARCVGWTSRGVGENAARVILHLLGDVKIKPAFTAGRFLLAPPSLSSAKSVSLDKLEDFIMSR